jgi:hypothetical protein
MSTKSAKKVQEALRGERFTKSGVRVALTPAEMVRLLREKSELTLGGHSSMDMAGPRYVSPEADSAEAAWRARTPATLVGKRVAAVGTSSASPLPCVVSRSILPLGKEFSRTCFSPFSDFANSGSAFP